MQRKMSQRLTSIEYCFREESLFPKIPSPKYHFANPTGGGSTRRTEEEVMMQEILLQEGVGDKKVWKAQK